MSVIVVLNCGSSSIKFAVFNADVASKQALLSGQIQGIGSKPNYKTSIGDDLDLTLEQEKPYRAALVFINQKINAYLAGREIKAFAHRVVHGGSLYNKPVILNDAVLADLNKLIALAPLHQPYALEAIAILQQECAQIPQIACFDTSFHSSIGQLEHLLPVPYEFYEKGVRRYGFHGLSYEYIAHVMAEKFPSVASGKVIVAHLGSGASLSAIKDGKSFATTMGFSALEGLMMGTRTGAIDPGVLLYLLETEKLSTKELTDLLYKKSGLLGISGVSNDVRILLEAEAQNNARAKLALDFYVKRVVKEIGSLTASLGGLDLLIFTAGIGERSAIMRERICAELAWLGLELNKDANEQNQTLISSASSKIVVGVEPTNEEWIAAKHARDLIA